MNRAMLFASAILLTAILIISSYAMRLRHRTAVHLQKAATAVALPPPAPSTTATIFVPDLESGGVHPKSVALTLPPDEPSRARALLEASLRSTVGKDSAIDAVYLLPDGTAVVDLSPSLAASQASGIESESMTVESVVRTLQSSFPQVRRVRFLVGGKVRDTLAGHADLTVAYNTEPN